MLTPVKAFLGLEDFHAFSNNQGKVLILLQGIPDSVLQTLLRGWAIKSSQVNARKETGCRMLSQ